jgi:hypothetical protein
MIYGSDICIEQVCVVPVRSKGAVDHKKVLNTGLRKFSVVHPRMRFYCLTNGRGAIKNSK